MPDALFGMMRDSRRLGVPKLEVAQRDVHNKRARDVAQIRQH